MRTSTSLTHDSRSFASPALLAIMRKLACTIPAVFLAAVGADTPLQAAGIPPAEWEDPHQQSTAVPFSIAHLSGDLLSFATGPSSHLVGSRETDADPLALLSDAGPLCMPTALAMSIHGEHPSAANSFKCKGDDVTVDVSVNEGVITIVTCVTNGSCEGSWDGFDISISVNGTTCFTVTHE